MDKIKEFPIQIPENLSLSDLSEAHNVESNDDGDAKLSMIERIEQFLGRRYQFRYNLIKNTPEISKDGFAWKDIDERQSKRIEGELMRAGFKGFRAALDVFFQTVKDFDPVADYLNKLPAWDGQTDYIGHLASFVKVTPDRRTWFDLMFKKHLLRLLACATGRIAFNKHCLVLVGGQDAGKSSFTRFLCPPPLREYYTEEIDFENKDGLVALARNLFVNLDELRNLSRQDINKVKSFISKDHIKARLPFDRRETKLRRICSFFGSTNNAEFLTDETGNVRWLVLEILDIQHDCGGPNGYEKQVSISQVYAQAYALLQSGFECQLTIAEKQTSEGYNKAHTKRPIEYELLLKFYDKSEDKAHFLTASDIKRNLEITGQKLSAENIGRALRMMEVERVPKKVNGQTLYGYLLRETGEKDWAKLSEDNNATTEAIDPPF